MNNLKENHNFPKVLLLTGDKGSGKFTLSFHLLNFFFSDSILSRVNIRYKSFEKFAKPLVVGLLSLIPITLAAASALVATTLFNY